MPSLDDLRTGAVILAVPVADDLVPFYDVSEYGNSPVKKTRVGDIGVQLDANGNLPVDGFVVADSSTLALADGVIGWNESQSSFVRHDGTTIGGALVVPIDPLHARGSRAVLGSEITSDTVIELHRFPLTSSQAAVGKRFRISGTYSYAANGTRPTDVFFGVIPEASEDAGFSVLYGASHSGTTLKVVKSSIYWEFELADAGGGEYSITQYAHNSSETRLTGSTTSVVAVDAPYEVADPGLVGQAQDLVLQAHFGGTVGAATSFLVWDLVLEETN